MDTLKVLHFPKKILGHNSPRRDASSSSQSFFVESSQVFLATVTPGLRIRDRNLHPGFCKVALRQMSIAKSAMQIKLN